jgi:uncharacterized tellurite resistance protein B-like protein
MLFTAAAASTAPAPSSESALALIILISIAAAWIGLRTLLRGKRAHDTERVIGVSFPDFALEALANAARIDGEVNPAERTAIVAAMSEINAAPFAAARVDQALAQARLSQDQLIDYLRAKSGIFSRAQKTLLLKSLLQLIVADDRFDEAEHAALVDYTEAVGFDRKSAPELLRGLTRDFTRGNIT